MERYRFFPHTADAKFRAFGKSLEEAFVHAAFAVASLMWNWQKIAKNITISVTVEGKSLEQLLVNYLEEILYLMETRNFLLGFVNTLFLEKKKKGWILRASFVGDECHRGYEIFGDVKAITYNEMIINSQAPFWVQVVVDI